MSKVLQKSLKIGFVFDDSLDRTDGVQQYILTLGRWLQESGHDVRYLVGETSIDHPLSNSIYSLSRNISVRGNQNTLSLPLPASRRRIKSILKEENFDILHVQLPYNPLLAGRVIASAPKQTSIIGSFHIVGAGNFERIGSKVLARIQRRTLKKFSTFLAVSPAAQMFALDTYKIDMVVSPNVVNVSQFKNGKKQDFLRGEQATITFLGRLVERKGCEYLLRALALLQKNDDLVGVRVNICGDGPLRLELEEYVRNAGLSDIVIFHGYIPENEKSDYLASSDIAVFPATGGESFGIVLIEAMAANYPVVLGGANEGYITVLDGSENQLFSPTDSEQLAALIKLHLHDRKVRSAAKKWQQNRIKHFDVSYVGPHMVDVYQTAVLATSTRNDYTKHR